ncbi:hypothetical protein A3862_27460 [Methylobacterium sp. XJLW]|uniref:hypothetical protein n=1 Tax=Methylobacterium sp. XJLW TaxID=739141 RepID=UPI000DAADF91|nr:hypothetical protein [Methylobacterium sp. XJLW]AWV18820.1 hypothetical protein A3862_27460 [Methylobacterium sp. XJLW]
MARITTALTAFNRGEVSRLALGRVDVDKLRLAAEECVNWIPHTLGPMQVRPGLAYVNDTAGNAKAYTLPFVYSTQDTALLELTPGVLRIITQTSALRRPATGSSFPGGAWQTSVQGNGSVTISGQIALDVPSIGGYAIARAPVGVSSPGVLHALRIVVLRGPIRLRIGSSAGLDDLVGELSLDVGTHSIAFTPGAAAWAEFQNRQFATALIGSVALESAGELRLPTSWGDADLPNVRWDQSANVVFLACAGKPPMRIQRPTPFSWSIVPYRADDGPFAAGTPPACKLQVSNAQGYATVTASRPVFQSGHANSLLQVFTPNANATFALGATGAAMPAVRVSGVGVARSIAFNVSGSFSGSWQLERSITGPNDGFAAVPQPITSTSSTTSTTSTSKAIGTGSTSGTSTDTSSGSSGSNSTSGTSNGTSSSTSSSETNTTGTSNSTTTTQKGGTAGNGTVFTANGNGGGTYQDDLDNVVAWYRISATSLTSGVINAQIIHGGSGGRTAVLRILAVDSPTSARAQVIQPPSSDNPSDSWQFGDWSDAAGWPTAVALFDGRLGFSGGDRLWMSVSDAFDSFAAQIDDGSGGATVGDSSAISRSIGYGPVATINWMLPLTRLLLGTAGSEVSVRSSALDAPLTPTGGMAMRDCSTYGSALVPAVKCDTRGLFADRSGRRLLQLAYDVNSQDYGASDLTRLHPDLFLGNAIVRIAVQRQPNTRIHCVRADGTVAVLVFEPNDDVAAWYRIETDGFVEDVYVLPGQLEDAVYYTVNRSGTRCREQMARLDQARGGGLNLMADAHVSSLGSPISALGGLTHLNGKTVCIWADGKDRGTAVVSGGQVALGGSYSAVCVGLPYQARWRSAKLAYGAPQGGTALNRRKRTIGLGLILADAHIQGLQIGQSYDALDPMPWTEDDIGIDLTGGWYGYDEQEVELPGSWTTDARLCLVGQAPRPCTVMAASLTMETSVETGMTRQ